MTQPSATYEPTVGKRLLWWCGFYFGVQLPCLPAAPFFPMGLTFFFLELWGKKVPKWEYGLVLGLAYLFYVVHLALSLWVREKRMFQLLLGILILALGLNVTGCGEVVNGFRAGP